MSAPDRAVQFPSGFGIPVIGDWNGDGISKIGVYKALLWHVDYLGNPPASVNKL